MELSAPEQVEAFLQAVGDRLPVAADIYIYGGSALLLIGGHRNTADLDFTLRAALVDECRAVIQAVANDLNLDAEENAPVDFMPLPTGSDQRHLLIGRYGALTAYVFDPYSMAVMKIDRAFASDFEDVHFLIKSGQVTLDRLAESIEDVARRYDEPIKLRRNFAELKRGL
jgi:hypothetical protein